MNQTNEKSINQSINQSIEQLVNQSNDWSINQWNNSLIICNTQRKWIILCPWKWNGQQSNSPQVNRKFSPSPVGKAGRRGMHEIISRGSHSSDAAFSWGYYSSALPNTLRKSKQEWNFVPPDSTPQSCLGTAGTTVRECFVTPGTSHPSWQKPGQLLPPENGSKKPQKSNRNNQPTD